MYTADTPLALVNVTTTGNFAESEGCGVYHGGSDALSTQTLDLDGGGRVAGGTIDLGAYESP